MQKLKDSDSSVASWRSRIRCTICKVLLQEADGTGGSSQRGIENITRLKQDAFNLARDQFAPELLLLEQNMKSQDSHNCCSAKASMEDKRKQFEQTAMANMGFLERNKALADLSAEEGSVFWASWLISLLIILIEIGRCYQN
jgi:hypothetical protein